MNKCDKLVEAVCLTKYFPVYGRSIVRQVVGQIRAVDQVSFFVNRGETLGLVGESGCGKSTLGRCLVRLYRPNSGQIVFEGKDIGHLSAKDLRRKRRDFQIMFQDPFSSLNPRKKVEFIVAEPFIVQGVGDKRWRRERVRDLLQEVGLSGMSAERYPNEFSGGQRQRIALARALALKPKFIVLDEPVSALDVSIQAQIINLLLDLQQKHELTYLFIAHDLSVVRNMSDRIAVMYLGKIMEIAMSTVLYDSPLHPYTQCLLSAVLIADPKIEHHRQQIVLEGDVPSPRDPPSGCCFHPRCPSAQPMCAEQEPALEVLEPNHWSACWFPGPVKMAKSNNG